MNPFMPSKLVSSAVIFAVGPGMGLQKVAANNVANAHPWETVMQLHSLCP